MLSTKPANEISRDRLSISGCFIIVNSYEKLRKLHLNGECQWIRIYDMVFF